MAKRIRKPIEVECAELNAASAAVAKAKRLPRRAPAWRVFGCELVELGGGRYEIRKNGEALASSANARDAQETAREFWT